MREERYAHTCAVVSSVECTLPVLSLAGSRTGDNPAGTEQSQDLCRVAPKDEKEHREKSGRGNHPQPFRMGDVGPNGSDHDSAEDEVPTGVVNGTASNDIPRRPDPISNLLLEQPSGDYPWRFSDEERSKGSKTKTTERPPSSLSRFRVRVKE